MPDPKKLEPVERVEIVDTVEKTHTETIKSDTQDSAKTNSATPDSGKEEGDKVQKGPLTALMTPVVFLLFMIFLMILVLLVINFRSADDKSSTPETASGGAGVREPSIAELRATLTSRRSELNRQRIAAGLPPLDDGAEPMDEIARRINADTNSLIARSDRFEQMLGEKDAEITQIEQDLLRAEQLRQSLSSEVARVQADYQRALVSGSDAENLRRLLEEAQTQRDALSSQLAEAQQLLADNRGSVTEAEYADLQRRYQEAMRAKDFFEDRAEELERRLGQAELFAKSEDELLPAAVELFRRLRALEGVKDSELTTEYSKLGVELGANVLRTLDFATGSSELSQAEMDQLEAIAANDIPEGDLAFIVGYASRTGDAVLNQRLSSDRATVAAEHYNSKMRTGQRVQAVYLGQTDRFSGSIPIRNQICEIWRIRKK